MLAIELRFPSGRYHATPWDRHVNEGVVEWPPCPFRLLRALVATWHLKARAELDEADVAQLVESFAPAVPRYCLPPIAAAHTRHFMPIGEIKDGVERTTKVFDTFVHLGADVPIEITWPGLTLGSAQERTLRLLLSNLGYLGRSESWVEGRLLMNTAEDGGETQARANVVPLDPQRTPSPEEELIRVLCPMTSNEILAWRIQAFEQELDRRLADKRHAAQAKGKDASAQKLTKSERDKIDANLPRTLMDALQGDTGELRRQGWSGVPGTRWVDYLRPRDLLLGERRTGTSKSIERKPTVARFALSSPVPPRLTEVVSFAERVRTALMSRSGAAPVFSGKDEKANPLRGNQHAYILPEANGAHGRVTHITLYAPMGFDTTARRAMDSLRDVWGRGVHDVQLVLLGVGAPEDFAGANLEAGQCPLLMESDTWISRTPFVPTRHPKASKSGVPKLDPRGLQISSPVHDLLRLLRAGLSTPFPEPSRVEAIDATDLNGKRTPWFEFDTLRRRGDGARSTNRSFGFRLVFPRPVRGPIAIGYGSHFGLGVFTPESNG